MNVGLGEGGLVGSHHTLDNVLTRRVKPRACRWATLNMIGRYEAIESCDVKNILQRLAKHVFKFIHLQVHENSLFRQSIISTYFELYDHVFSMLLVLLYNIQDVSIP